MTNLTGMENKLRELTQRQCQILYWVCRGMTYKEVAKQIGFGQDLVQAEMSQVYRLLGLTQLSTSEKRRLLVKTICPIHERLVNDPETDCLHRVIEVNPPAPDPRAVEEVKEDERRGLIPLDRALVYVGAAGGEEEKTSERGLASRPTYPLVVVPSPKGNTLVGIVLGILGTLLVLALIVCAVVVLAGGPQKLFTAFQPPLTPAIQTVVITQPASKPFPVTPAAPVVVTVLVTPVQPTSALATAEPSPTAVPPKPATQASAGTAPCSPNGSSANLAGKVASDIPGTRLCLGQSVTSVVDDNTKQRDVYALNLAAGQEVRFTVTTASGCVNFYLLNLGSKSVETNQYSQAFQDGTCNNEVRNFTPAVAGTYYLDVVAAGSGVAYTLSAKPTTSVVPGDQVASDIPGTKISLGDSRASVVDNDTKRRDVYAVDLAAGQGVRSKVTTNVGCLNFYLLNPGSKSIETNQYSQAFQDGTCNEENRDFTPAVSGTYYLDVVAAGSGVTYALTLIALK